jgi:hypothetical protein
MMYVYSIWTSVRGSSIMPDVELSSLFKFPFYVGMSFGGYRQSFVAHVGARKGKPVGMGWEFEATRLYSEKDQKQRGEDAADVRVSGFSKERKKKLFSALGCRGRCEILAQLEYADLNSTWVLGVSHTFLYGVAKGFIHLLLGRIAHDRSKPSSTPFKLTEACVKEVSARCKVKRWTLDNEFGRNFADITEKNRYEAICFLYRGVL